MPRRERNTQVDRAELNSYGPSWYDVWIAHQELRSLVRNHVELRLESDKSYNNKAGLVFRVYIDGHFVISAGKRFLDNGAESAKTAAAAAWVALTRAYHLIEEGKAVFSGGVVQLVIMEREAAPASPSDGQDE